MAEGKKSFVVYTSWKLWLDALSDEQKGQWLNWMFDYTNDLDPEYPSDKAVEVACRMAQDTLKRDLKKYEAKLERIKNARNQNPNNNKELEQNNNRTEIELKSDKHQLNNSGVNVNVNDNVNKEDKSSIVVNNVSKDTTAEVSDEASQAVIILPCLKGYNHKIFKEDIAYYQKLYPAVDIEQQLRNMLGWLESNPANKKTEAGVKSFITRWLSKCQDKAPKVESQNIGFGEYDVVEGKNDKPHFGGFQMLGESDEDYEKRTGIKRYKPNKRN